MFSELCRETLRKAAVCYSSGRAGSPSPSPPTSPPPSPAKEAKTTANVDLANVRDACHEARESGTSGRRSPQQTSSGTTTEYRDYTGRRSPTASGDSREKRSAMPVDSGKRVGSPEARDGKRGCSYSGTDSRDGRSVSPEKGRLYEDNRGSGTAGGFEYRRSDSRVGRQSPVSPGSSPEPEDNSSTSGDEAGAASEETNQRSSSAHNRHSLTKEQTMHWFAQIGGDEAAPDSSDVKRRRSLYDEDSLDGEPHSESEGRDSSGSAKDVDRAKLVRERQNEERQRKLEELRQQALAAQRFREQREEERRRRIDELRSRDNDRFVRNQVEERKRLICEAERERREAILRKNQEREARIEAKKRNERSHIVFAFGSSTPRMLEPADTGGSTFWGTRRATSTTNVMMFSAAQPLTRRSSERELDGSKKRATSAGGLDRKLGEDMKMSSSMYEVFNWNSSPDPPLTPAKHKRASLSLPPTTDIFAIDDKSDSDTRRPMIQRAASGEESDGTPGTPSSVYLRVNRRRTDLMPTIPSPRDGPPSSGRSSSAKAFTRSPDLSGDAKLTKDSKPPLPKVHNTPKKPSTPKMTEIKKPTEKLAKNAKASPRITPKATPLQSPGIEHEPFIRESTGEIIKNEGKEEIKSDDKQHEEKKDQGTEKSQQEISAAEQGIEEAKKSAIVEQPNPAPVTKQVKEESNLGQENQAAVPSQETPKKKEDKQEKKPPAETEAKQENIIEEQVDMSASMIAKIRITTEEEAKAAIAERRRLAREQAEREAELERQRLEEEARLEAERLRAEEEEQRRLEEESLRLANEAREAEEQRLRLAIEEAKRREEEDRRRKEEEARQKQEKEEAERKAREEAERQRIEMAERLKKEEEERLARRKRVEAIMLRTRGKNQSNTPTKGEGGDGDKLKEDNSPNDENKPAPGNKGEDVMTASLISEATQQFISGEQRAHHTENSTKTDIVHNGTHSNGINESKIVLDNNQGNVEGELNGHHTNHGNGINNQSITLDNATVKQNNVTNNLLDLTEFDSLSNSSSGPILQLTSNLANEDTLNSNLNPAAIPFTPMANTYMPTAANANVNPFQDSFINNKPQDNSQVPDLLS
nr:ensconsin-like isoform X13 [Nomia melanderi]